MKEYIKQKHKMLLKEGKEWSLFKKIPFTIINNFTFPLQIPSIISFIERSLDNRSEYISYLEGVYVGNFNILKEKSIQAMFIDGVIYVSSNNNENVKEDQVAKDIIHEIGHSLENEFSIDIYGDQVLQREFLSKRKRLFSLLNWDGINLPEEKFLNNTEYNKEIDDILFKKIGYDKLNGIISGLFLSPYSVTDIREYFSNGFETFMTGNDVRYLKKVCPALYFKIEALNEIIKGDDV